MEAPEGTQGAGAEAATRARRPERPLSATLRRIVDAQPASRPGSAHDGSRPASAASLSASPPATKKRSAFAASARQAAKVAPHPLEIKCQYDASFFNQLPPSERPSRVKGDAVYPRQPPRVGPVYLMFRRYAKVDDDPSAAGWILKSNAAALGYEHRYSQSGVGKHTRENDRVGDFAQEHQRLTVNERVFLELLDDFGVMPTICSRADAMLTFRAALAGAASPERRLLGTPDLGGKALDFDGFCGALARLAVVAFVESTPDPVPAEAHPTSFLAKANACVSRLLEHMGILSGNSRPISTAISRFERFSGERGLRSNRNRWDYVAANERVRHNPRVYKGHLTETKPQEEGMKEASARDRREDPHAEPANALEVDAAPANELEMSVERQMGQRENLSKFALAARGLFKSEHNKARRAHRLSNLGNAVSMKRSKNDLRNAFASAPALTFASELTRPLALSRLWDVPALLVRDGVLRFDTQGGAEPHWHHFPEPRALDMGAVPQGQTRAYRVVLRYRGSRIAQIRVSTSDLPPGTHARYSEGPLVSGMPRVVDLFVPFPRAGEWVGSVRVALLDGPGVEGHAYTVPVYARCFPRTRP